MTTNTVNQPIDFQKAQDKVRQEKFEEKTLREWADKTFKDEKGAKTYDEVQFTRSLSFARAGIHAGSLPLKVGATSGLFMFFGMAMIFQIALTMTDKELAKRFSESDLNKLLGRQAKNLVESTNYSFESVFNNISGLFSGDKFGYVGEQLPPTVAQKTAQKMKEIAQEIESDNNYLPEEKFGTNTERQASK